MSEALRYPELVDISTATSTQGNVTVVGVVVDVMGAPLKSRSSSSFITFTLKDSDLDNGHTWDGLKIKYFRENESQLPPVQVGDVLLLRNLWVRAYSSKPLGVAAQDKTIPWALFRHESDPMSIAKPMCGPIPFEPSFTEKRLAMSLLEHSTKIKGFRISSTKPVAPQFHSGTTAPKSKYSAPGCFTLIKDAKYNANYKTYVDLIGEVIKIYPPRGDHVLMYITDYTMNRNLPDHDSDDEKGQEGDYFNYQRNNRRRWTGPSGQLSLAVTVWSPYDSYVRENVNEGDIVYLSNVEIARCKFGTTMEAIIRTGNKYNIEKGKVRLITAKNDARAQELLLRKEEYWRRNPSKRKLAQDDEPPSRLKRLKKNQKQKAEAKKDESQTSIDLRARNAPNPNITAAYSSCSDLPIEDILTNESHNNVSPDGVKYRFPFQNLCYRSMVRVVDFFPHKLEDFAVPERQDDEPLARFELECATGEQFNRWEWRFCLLIESSSAPPPGQAREQMKLFVSDVEAVHLTGLDASE
ncbi:telomere-binding alpha subunit central domain protein [Aspergillus melleus]|uniref:telomere-binding alpha subunit central domain protein n=1 Tax=Aspergillus melleus TaxID=138277 RepID=UPI001E8D89DA|nr:uncharacterized protein LDX57_007234 [Aspergillus melleus]KAH8429566.1 hypothetical protein LDX57_007234 [Aspergillus melleus]